MISAAYAVVSAWFGGLPFKLISIVAGVAVVLLVLFGVYRDGKHSAEQAAAISLAKHNAEIAAKFMRDSKAAQDAAASERARAEELAAQVATLKEQVSHVAKGNSSPGVDGAVHSVRNPTAAVGKSPVSRSTR